MHADNRNVVETSPEDPINEIFLSLKRVKIPEDEFLNKSFFEDLHATGRNVVETSPEDPINKISLTLKKVREHIPEEENFFIAEQLK